MLEIIQDDKLPNRSEINAGLFDKEIKEMEEYWTSITPQEQEELYKIRTKIEDYGIIPKQFNKRMEVRNMLTLNWTKASSEGSRFSRGKHDYYAIIIRGIPEDHPKDCVVELYVTDKPMTAFEIKVSADSWQLSPISRSIVLGNLLPVTKISQTVENMKDTAERRENEMPNLNF